MIYENTPMLETTRLILRKFTMNDISAYFDIMSDKKANQYLPWFAVTTMAQALAYLQQNCLDLYVKPQAYRYAICLKKDNVPIGYCGFSDTDSHDIGYGLKSNFWHQGIITEATTAMVERIKNAGYPYITATHDIYNLRSGEVMKKLGMHYQYSYIEQWQPKDYPVTFRMYQRNFNNNSMYTFMEYWNKNKNHFVEKDVL